MITSSLQSVVILHHWLHRDNQHTEHFVDLIFSLLVFVLSKFLCFRRFAIYSMIFSSHLSKVFRSTFINCHCLNISFCLFLSITSASQSVKIFQKVFHILFIDYLFRTEKSFTFCLSTNLRQTISIWRSRTTLLCHQNFSALLFSLTFFVKSIIDTFQSFQTSYDSLLTSLFLQIFDQLWYADKFVTIKHFLSSRLFTFRNELQSSQTFELLRKFFTIKLSNIVKFKSIAIFYISDSMRLTRRSIITSMTRQNEIHLFFQMFHVYHVDIKTLTIHSSLVSVLNLTKQCSHLAYHRWQIQKRRSTLATILLTSISMSLIRLILDRRLIHKSRQLQLKK